MVNLPEVERKQLMALQQRHDQLLAMLPTDPDLLVQLDPAQLNAKLADVELISTEMMAINAAERAILEELERCP